MSPSIQFNRVEGLNGESLTFFIDGQMYVIDDNHAEYYSILEACGEDDPDLALHLMNVAEQLSKTFQPLSERVRIDNDGDVYFDGDIADNAITSAMVRYYRDGEEADLLALANFFEKIATNPSQNSRDQLYRWLETHNFTLLDDGDILAYKGVTKPNNDGIHLSIHSGTAMVDGEVHHGQIPNPIGSVIEMPRSEVNEDPNTPCAKGLHVGTFEFARDFARQGPVLAVSVNPRDVISVPRDSRHQKVRTCRYTVLEIKKRMDERLSRPTHDYASVVSKVEDTVKKTPRNWIEKVQKRK